MRILVSGGAGYIGSVLIPALLDAGHDVTVLDNFMWRQASLNHLCADPHFCVVRGDARDAAILLPLLTKADVFVPLAALVGAPLCDADEIGAVTTNRDAVVGALQNMSRDQRVVIPVTNSGYGIGEKDQECTEDTPLRPVSLYGRTKVEAEKAVLDRGNGISLRLATVFGMSPRMRLDLLVNDFVYRAVSDRALVLFEAHFRRNYVHVRDVVRAFLFVIDNFENMCGWPYNVGLSDANLTKRELCERIQRHVPEFFFTEAATGYDPDRRDYVVSNARIEAAGFRTQHSLDDGILELIKGYRMIRNAVYGNV